MADHGLPDMLSPLGLGGSGLAGLYDAVSASEASRVLDEAIRSGVTYVDTAPMYGAGLSETRIGRYLAEIEAPRVTLSTKVGRVLSSEPEHPLGWAFDFRPAALRASLESSLERLGRSSVEIVYLHDPDENEFLECGTHESLDVHVDRVVNESLPALEDLRREGLFRFLGIGVNQWQMPLAVLERADLDVVLLAGRYTLLEQGGLALLDECADRGVTVVVGAPFNSGILATEVPSDGSYNYEPAPPEVADHVARIRTVCRRYGVPLGAAALQFPLAHPAVVSVLAGVSSVAELRENITKIRAPIDGAVWSELIDLELISGAARCQTTLGSRRLGDEMSEPLPRVDDESSGGGE